MKISSIGFVESPYPTKFGVPRQPELASDIDCVLVVDIASLSAPLLNSIPAGSYLWVVWSFSCNVEAARRRFSPTVRPPLLDGTKRVGVFATRSSFRPNSLAISALNVSGEMTVSGNEARIPARGADIVDGTPLFALHPYDPRLHARPDASSGWTSTKRWQKLEVLSIDNAQLELVEEKFRKGLFQLLEQDPRPAYTREGHENREFWVPFANVAVFFKVSGRALRVTHIERLSHAERDELARSGAIQRFANGREPICGR